MSWIIVLVSLAAMLFGFIPMAAVDRFNVRRYKMKTPAAEVENRSVLIYGRSDTAELFEARLAAGKTEYDHVYNELQLSKIKIYGKIFVLSNGDYSNLLMSSELNVRYPEALQVLLCNDRTYMDVFKKTGKKFLLLSDGNITEQLADFLM